MVGVHRVQASLASQGATATTHMPGWVHWPQAPLTFVIAVLIGWLSILWAYHRNGRPFGSLQAFMRTITLIVVTALIAAVLSILVPHLPFSLGIFIPALLGGAVIKGEEETIQELRVANADLAAFVKIGIFYFVIWAADQIAEDRTTWCEKQIKALKSADRDGVENQMASLSKFASAARELSTRLDVRVGKDQKTQVADNFLAFNQAFSAARNANNDQEFSDEYDSTRNALFLLLKFAYNWKLKDLEFTVTPKPPAQPSSPPAQPSNPPEQARKRLRLTGASAHLAATLQQANDDHWHWQQRDPIRSE